MSNTPQARLKRIAEAHHKCGWTWPCPTNVWATTDRDDLDLWDSSDGPLEAQT